MGMKLIDRREQILAAVTAVFAAKGFAGARITELARAAKVSQALPYKLFGNKEGSTSR
ncbi:MAG: TetR/AcrR family transcriptional regulator [Planctomycetota bacterium]|jgi:AcrR family transcriptional regulator